jgi:glycosyltransferase involved in cell wall biosynthesis
MERLADALEDGCAQRADVRMRSTRVRASKAARRVGLARADSYVARFLRYPLAARRQTAGVYHVIDHGYAHVAALLPRARTVISCHDLMLMKAAEGAAGFAPGRLSLARFRWSTSYLRRAARVVCPSEATKGDVVRLLGIAPERIAVVPYGIGASFRPFAEAATERLRAALRGEFKHVVLHVSTGDPYKNVETTLRVVARLNAGGMAVRLVRAGRPFSPAQRRLARDLGVDGAVLDCGTVPEARLVELYNAAELLLFPSYEEGFGWPPLEAMACGTPVITSDCPALAEIGEGAALQFGAEDADGMAAAARLVLSSPDTAHGLRLNGFDRAARFSWQRTIDGFVAVYAGVSDEAARYAERGRPACAA